MIIACWLSKGSMSSSVQFSCLVVPDSLWPYEPQHARLPYPSPTPGVHPNPCPSSRWCHPTISSFAVPFSSCPQSFPASGSFQMSQLFTSGGQSIGVSASTSVLPMNTQDWSPLGWIWLIFPSHICIPSNVNVIQNFCIHCNFWGKFVIEFYIAICLLKSVVSSFFIWMI